MEIDFRGTQKRKRPKVLEVEVEVKGWIFIESDG